MGMTTVMPVKPPVKSDDYYLLAPAGDPIRVPAALYEAVKRFVVGKAGFAQIVVTIKTGGIAGVEATEKTIYK